MAVGPTKSQGHVTHWFLFTLSTRLTGRACYHGKLTPAIIICMCNVCNVWICVPVLGATAGGFDMIVGTVVMGPAVVGEKMWAGRPIVCDWWKW